MTNRQRPRLSLRISDLSLTQLLSSWRTMTQLGIIATLV
jgi:hypothetical protein